jgi:hypothetical protein
MYVVVLARGPLQSHFEEVAFLVHGLPRGSNRLLPVCRQLVRSRPMRVLATSPKNSESTSDQRISAHQRGALAIGRPLIAVDFEGTEVRQQSVGTAIPAVATVRTRHCIGLNRGVRGRNGGHRTRQMGAGRARVRNEGMMVGRRLVVRVPRLRR